MSKKTNYIKKYLDLMLVFILCVLSQDCIQAQDITGAWKGELRLGDVTGIVEIAFFKTSNNLYSGTSYVIWHKTSEKSDLKVHRERKLFNAVVSDNVLTIMEYDTVHIAGETPASISGGVFTVKNDNSKWTIGSSYPGISCNIVRTNIKFPDSLNIFFKPLAVKTPEIKPDIHNPSPKTDTNILPVAKTNGQKSSGGQWEILTITTKPPKGIFDQTKLPMKAITEWISGTNLASIGKYKQAIDSFIASAELGNALSAYEVGLNLNFCFQIKQDFDLAAEWYQFSADNGNPNALARLSVLISLGQVSSIKDEGNRAELMSEKAFELGSSFATINNFSKAKFVDKDPAQAANWYGKYSLMLEGAKAGKITSDLKQAFMENYARVKSQSGLDLANTILLGIDGKTYDPGNLTISNVTVTHLNGKFETEYAAIIVNPTDGSRPIWHFKVNQVFINGKPVNIIRAATVGETFAIELKKVELQRAYGQLILPGFDDLYMR
ncbi:MAG: hypothetical protein QM802_22975 [Agriterribacter sp.]